MNANTNANTNTLVVLLPSRVLARVQGQGGELELKSRVG